jgi:hypothetical protein
VRSVDVGERACGLEAGDLGDCRVRSGIQEHPLARQM